MEGQKVIVEKTLPNVFFFDEVQKLDDFLRVFREAATTLLYDGWRYTIKLGENFPGNFGKRTGKSQHNQDGPVRGQEDGPTTSSQEQDGATNAPLFPVKREETVNLHSSCSSSSSSSSSSPSSSLSSSSSQSSFSSSSFSTPSRNTRQGEEKERDVRTGGQRTAPPPPTRSSPLAVLPYPPGFDNRGPPVPKIGTGFTHSAGRTGGGGMGEKTNGCGGKILAD